MPTNTIPAPPQELSEIDEDFLAVFGALSEPVRMQIIRMMVDYGDEDFPCTALDEELPIAKSTISYHVQILRRAGLISVRKAGRNYFYRLRGETLESYAPALLSHLRGN